jgi:alkanesulfonate monooxygenase SsuD/methylene tetrahydromethanopterin reductase-like flavin-dependent oxidoreductase (luciferase family)
VLAAGVGAAPDDAGFYRVGEVMDLKTRAALMDEGLTIIAGLWTGERFSFDGAHYHVDNMILLPRPVQQPRPPIWVVGSWPRPKSLGRAAQYDGLLPTKHNPDGKPGTVTPEDIAAMRAWMAAHRPADAAPFDIIWEGRTPGDDLAGAAAQVRPFVEAGITWWLESMWEAPNALEDVRARIRQGPPRVA